jgi:hypothetical protein
MARKPQGTKEILGNNLQKATHEIASDSWAQLQDVHLEI